MLSSLREVERVHRGTLPSALPTSNQPAAGARLDNKIQPLALPPDTFDRNRHRMVGEVNQRLHSLVVNELIAFDCPVLASGISARTIYTAGQMSIDGRVRWSVRMTSPRKQRRRCAMSDWRFPPWARAMPTS
jgi:hypothetical protein